MRYQAILWELARTGWKPVDPDVIEARKIVAKSYTNNHYLEGGAMDHGPPVQTVLAGIRRGRELEREAAALEFPPPPRPAGPTREEIAAIILESQPPKGFKHRWPNALAKADAILALFTGGRG